MCSTVNKTQCVLCCSVLFCSVLALVCSALVCKIIRMNGEQLFCCRKRYRGGVEGVGGVYEVYKETHRRLNFNEVLGSVVPLFLARSPPFFFSTVGVTVLIHRVAATQPPPSNNRLLVTEFWEIDTNSTQHNPPHWGTIFNRDARRRRPATIYIKLCGRHGPTKYVRQRGLEGRLVCGSRYGV